MKTTDFMLDSTFSMEDEVFVSDGASERRNVNTAPGLISLSRASSPSAESFTSLSRMSVTELRNIAAAGGGRNAVRAKSLLERAEGKRLRENERPADIDVYGEDRDKPVRYSERAQGSANVDYRRVEMNSASGRHSPDTSLRSLNASPVSLVAVTNSTMEIWPQKCEIKDGVMKGGEKYSISLNVNNIGLEGVRYNIKYTGSGDVKIVEKPEGMIAAGMKCIVRLELAGNEGAIIDGGLTIKSQNDVVHIPLTGTFGAVDGAVDEMRRNKYFSKV